MQLYLATAVACESRRDARALSGLLLIIRSASTGKRRPRALLWLPATQATTSRGGACLGGEGEAGQRAPDLDQPVDAIVSSATLHRETERRRSGI